MVTEIEERQFAIRKKISESRPVGMKKILGGGATNYEILSATMVG